MAAIYLQAGRTNFSLCSMMRLYQFPGPMHLYVNNGQVCWQKCGETNGEYGTFRNNGSKQRKYLEIYKYNQNTSYF